MTAQDELQEAKNLLEKELAVRQSRQNLVPYMKLMMPDITDPDDVTKSRFVGGWHHDKLCKKLELLEKGVIRRLIVTMPPRHSKSETCTRGFPSWYVGKRPQSQVLIAGYSETFAQQEFGREIRSTMGSQRYAEVFPACQMDKGGKSAGFIMTTVGGKMTMTGVGGGMTGKGADLLVIDDPIKNAEQADSEVERNNIWNWYMTTARTRLQPGGRILIVMTRWHEDDLIGRILDTETNSQAAIDKWEVLHLPALRDPETGMASSNAETSMALWPNWQPKEELLAIREDVTPRVWSALYQGQPTPEDGEYFTAQMIKEYYPYQLPPKEELRIYMAMDLAVSYEAKRDASCILTVGVDSEDNIWILDAVWERKAADDIVEAAIGAMRDHNPLIVWGEKGQISKSIGPFLRKRMQELGIYAYIEEETPTVDKQVRSRSIRARMSMGKVFFPKNAHWFSAAKTEMLKFPNGRHDDFVDALAWIGLGLEREVGHKHVKPVEQESVGSINWIKKQSAIEIDLNGLATLDLEF